MGMCAVELSFLSVMHVLQTFQFGRGGYALDVKANVVFLDSTDRPAR